jgi:opacity protein-like surface antigen
VKALLLGAAVLVSAPTTAEQPAREAQQFAVSPFIGYRVGGSFRLIDAGQHVELDDHGSFALALDARADESTQYELFYGRQSTVLRGAALAPVSIEVEYLHIGGTVALDEAQRVKPYLAGGLGITRFNPDPALGHEGTRFSLSLALGLRVPVSRHFSLRLEGRGLLTPVNTDSAERRPLPGAGAGCRVFPVRLSRGCRVCLLRPAGSHLRM